MMVVATSLGRGVGSGTPTLVCSAPISFPAGTSVRQLDRLRAPVAARHEGLILVHGE